MFLGVLVQKVQKKTYQKLTIGVETGYNVDFYTLRTRNYTMIENINVGDKVFSVDTLQTKNIQVPLFSVILVNTNLLNVPIVIYHSLQTRV